MAHLGSLTRALVGWAAFVATAIFIGGVVAPLAFLVGAVWPAGRERLARFAALLFGAYVRFIPFLRLEIVNPEKRLEGARILVANHQSRLDSPILLSLEPRVFGPVRGYMLRVPLVGWGIRLLGFFDIDVAPRASLQAAKHAAERSLREGRPLLFYPEGTRSRDFQIGAFHRGAARIALDHGIPIQPVVIEGVEEVLPPGVWRPTTPPRYPVKVCYLDPVRVEVPAGAAPAARREAVRAATERVRRAMVERLDKLRAQRRDAPGPR
ncbi:MAG: lysophospholipid acyltransferase family protein [Myxococcota bacterium]